MVCLVKFLRGADRVSVPSGPNPAGRIQSTPRTPCLFQGRNPDTLADVRQDEVVQRAFTIDQPKHSLLRVGSDTDYRRAVLAQYAKRDRLDGHILFVPISPADLTAAGISVRHQPEDETPCDDANRRLHFDAEANESQLRALCRTLLSVGRGKVRFHERAVGACLAVVRQEGCKAGRETQVCRVDGCPTPSAA